MKRLLKVLKKTYLIPFIMFIISFVFLVPNKLALVFEYQNTGQVLAYLPLKKLDAFKIKYTHSIHLSSVIESYTITRKNEIKQYELMYENFAIGMPSNAQEGELFEERDGKYFIKNMNRIFTSFDLRLGKVRANHTILYKEQEYPLTDTIVPGTWVHFHVKKINLIQMMKGVNILES